MRSMLSAVCRADLAQQRRHLSPVITGVVDHVLQHLQKTVAPGWR